MAARGRTTKGRAIAQSVALLLGVVLIAVGGLGFLANATFDQAQPALDLTGDPVNGGLFLLFEVNGWHNVVHIASGLLLLVGGLSRGAAPGVLIAFGLVYAAVTVLGFLDKRNVLGIIPVNTADNLLHAALTVVALAVGILGVVATRSRRRPPPRPTSQTASP